MAVFPFSAIVGQDEMKAAMLSTLTAQKEKMHE